MQVKRRNEVQVASRQLAAEQSRARISGVATYSGIQSSCARKSFEAHRSHILACPWFSDPCTTINAISSATCRGIQEYLSASPGCPSSAKSSVVLEVVRSFQSARASRRPVHLDRVSSNSYHLSTSVPSTVWEGVNPALPTQACWLLLRNMRVSIIACTP